MKSRIQARSASAGGRDSIEARRGVGQLLDLAAIDRLHDRVAGREVAVKRADPDARPPRDLFEARLRARLPRTPPWPPRAGRRGCAGRRRGACALRAGAFPPAVRRERLVTSALKFRVSSC